MLPTSRRLRAPAPTLARIAIVCFLAACVSRADARTSVRPLEESELVRSLAAQSRTGVLYDLVLPLAHLERLDGSAAAPATDLATWREAYDELRRASLTPPKGPDLAQLLTGSRAAQREGVLPLALLDRAFERVRAEGPNAGGALVLSRAFAAAVLAPRTYHGAAVEFSLEADRFFSDNALPPRALSIDFADGRGFRAVTFGERVRVAYSATGVRTLEARLTRADGSIAQARFRFEVAALAAPVPDDTLHVTASIAYQGQYGTGDAYVYLAANHATLTTPIVVVEGFDLDNSMNWDELYALLNQESLVETLRGEGFDLVVLNFTDATEAIQQNAFVVTELIQQVQARIAPQATLAVVGASMGGLCSRYALAHMESHGVPYRVRTWISFDGPQAGADIPLGLQYWIDFFSDQSADAAAFLAILQRPAARQMLLYHLADPPGPTGEADPLRASMLADFAAVGDYPTLTRRVAIANGSGSGQTQGFLPGNQLVRWEYSSAFVAITGNVWAVPDLVSSMIFRGSIRIFLSTTSRTVTVSGTRPWDGAPGGSRSSMADLDSTAAPYGDIVALHPSHCFIPTISSLALATNDPFFDVAGAPDVLALTPFDAVYYPTANQEHVLITPESAAWVRSELEQGLVDVPGEAERIRREAALLGGAPNPFLGSTRVSFALSRPAHADVSVYGVDGRWVRRLLSAARPAGSHALVWDGRDARGAAVPAGVYFIRLDAGGVTDTRYVVKLD